MDSIIVKLAGKIIGLFKLGAASIFGRALFGAGISLAVFTIAYPQVKNFLQSKFLALPQNAQQLLAYAGVDVFMTLIISAVVARAGLQLFAAATTKLDEFIAGAAT